MAGGLGGTNGGLCGTAGAAAWHARQAILADQTARLWQVGWKGEQARRGGKTSGSRLRPRLALSANSLDHNRPRLKIKELFRLLFTFLRVRWRLLFPRGCPRLWVASGLRVIHRRPASGAFVDTRAFVFFAGARAFGSFVFFAGCRPSSPLSSSPAPGHS